MSHKGRVFTHDELPKRCTLDAEQQAEYLAEQTERYKIVGTGRKGQPVIAEEVIADKLAALSCKARRVAGYLLRTPLDVRKELLAAFDADGNLK